MQTVIPISNISIILYITDSFEFFGSII